MPLAQGKTVLTDLTKLSLAATRKGLQDKSFTATEVTGAYLGAI